MAHSLRDKQRVYLECREIFSGASAHLRRSKKILKLLNRKEQYLISLNRELTKGKVLDILKILLQKGVFESQEKAKIEFPEIFHSTSILDLQRRVSENDAVTSTAKVLEEVASSEGGNDCSNKKELENRNVSENTTGKFAGQL